MRKKNGRQRAMYPGKDTKRKWPSTKRPMTSGNISAILPNSRPLRLPRTRKGNQALLHKAPCRLYTERSAFHQSIDKLPSTPPHSQVPSESTQRLRLNGSKEIEKPGSRGQAQQHVHHESDRRVNRVEIERSNVTESSRRVGTAESWGWTVTMRVESVSTGEGTNHQFPCGRSGHALTLLLCCFSRLLKRSRPIDAPCLPAEILHLHTGLAEAFLFIKDDLTP